MKTLFKVVAALVVLVLVALVALPFLLEKNIDKIVHNAIEGKVNARIDYADIDLSLIKSFPKAQLDIQDLKIINNAPFANDTLFYANRLMTSFSFSQFFKGVDESIAIDKIRISTAVAKILVNKEGKANYDITIPDNETPEEETSTDESSSSMSLNLDYEIDNMRVVYNDSVSHTYVTIDNLMHSGKGDVSAELSDLDTTTDLELSFAMAGVEYTHNMPINLRAIVGVDQVNQKYTFKENSGKLNQIPLVFSGWVQMQEQATDMDISFTSEKASFKDLLASIPKAYKTDLKGVNASGKFDLHGSIKGQSTDTTIPKLDVVLDTRNASFKYPDLPKGISDITLVANVVNTSGLIDDTFVDIDAFHMKIDQDEFSASGKLSNLSKNPTVNAKAKGIVNLGNLKNAYPIGEETMNLTGVLNADISMNFSQSAIDNEDYENIKSEGMLGVSNFMVENEELPYPVEISEANIDFSPSIVTLEKFNMTTGTSDLSATGTLENIIPFALSDEVLKGDFNFNADKFKVSDFMTASEEGAAESVEETTEDSSGETSEGMIPSFLDITSRFNAGIVYYDNLELKNAKGELAIKDQKAALKDLSADFFNGNIGMIGEVSTANETPTFDMELDLTKLDITQSFDKIEMLQKLAPIASALQGLFTSEIKVKGSLQDDMTPDLNSLSGSATVKLLEAQLQPEKSTTLNLLNQKASFINLDDMNLNDLSTSLEFKDGKMEVQPFDFQLSKDIKVTASGSHAFDAGVDYNLNMDVPAKYMGSSASSMLSKLSAQEQSSMKVPVPITIGGSLTQPKVGIDMKSGITSLTNQIVSNQKQELKQKATSKVTEEISSRVSGKAGSVVSGLLGGNKTTSSEVTSETETEKKTDTKEAVKDAATNALKGLFGKKK